MQKETQQKSLTKKPNQTSLALPDDLAGDWGTEAVTSEDVIIPKLLLMHGQSELVMDKKATQGDLVKSTSQVVLGTEGTPVKVIPFTMYKTWVTSELVGKKYEWRGEEPLTPANSDKPWDYIMYKDAEYTADTDDKDAKKNGSVWRRDRAYNFYCLLVSELEEGKTTLPVRLQFKRTSHKAGKQIASFFSECKMEKRPPAVMQWEIGSELIKGEENNYYVFKVNPGEATTVEQIQSCKRWFIEMNQHQDKYKDDHSEEEAVTVKAAPSDSDEY